MAEIDRQAGEQLKRFAFYGRVSTEDQQDPASSRGWQLARSRSLIEPHGGVIVEEFFDIGQSRSLPWKRRPEALRLLSQLRDPGRGFTAVVIGEPARAFYGNQFGLTFPLFVHYGVELWVPEVGGAVDPGSDAHDLVMSLYGGMSKGERNRIKIRVRTAMASQAAMEGRFLGGRPPFGYRLADAGPHPNPAKAAIGQRLHRLEPDPATGPVVRRIFEDYVAGLGLYAIAEGLTRDGIPSPSAADPARNRHRISSGGAWSKSAVRVILHNPRYTGRQVWNRQRRDEVLIDVEDVALGHETKMRWNGAGSWVWSADDAHEALVPPKLFARVQELAKAAEHRPMALKRRTTERRYVLSGLLACGICNRRMQGNWNHGIAHYRCRFPNEYALANRVDHPLTVYIREDAVVPAVDDWLRGLGAPERIDETCQALAGSSNVDQASLARLEAAHRKLADCDERLAQYRAALDAGADPAMVAGWISEVQGERMVAQLSLNNLATLQPMSMDDAREIANDVRRIGEQLASADAGEKARLYSELGLRLTYHPGRRLVQCPSNSARLDLG